MKRQYLILMAAIILAGCSHKTGSQFDRLNNAVTNTAQAYFKAGVESAITVHYRWAANELEQGRRPSIAGIPDWSVKAKEFWATNYTDDAYIKLP